MNDTFAPLVPELIASHPSALAFSYCPDGQLTHEAPEIYWSGGHDELHVFVPSALLTKYAPAAHERQLVTAVSQVAQVSEQSRHSPLL